MIMTWKRYPMISYLNDVHARLRLGCLRKFFCHTTQVGSRAPVANYVTKDWWIDGLKFQGFELPIPASLECRILRLFKMLLTSCPLAFANLPRVPRTFQLCTASEERMAFCDSAAVASCTSRPRCFGPGPPPWRWGLKKPWKIHHLENLFLLEAGNFHCYVRLPECTSNCSGWLIEMLYIGLSIVNPIDMGNIIPYMTYKKTEGPFFIAHWMGWGRLVLGPGSQATPFVMIASEEWLPSQNPKNNQQERSIPSWELTYPPGD